MGETPDDPFAELDDVEGSRPDDPFAELDDPGADDFFEKMDAPAIDDESVWEAVIAGEDDTDEGPEGNGAEAVVPKEQYCKKCEHFSDPPDIACTNPGTEIVELVGIDSFRLRNCPVVAERGRVETVFPEEE